MPRYRYESVYRGIVAADDAEDAMDAAYEDAELASYADNVEVEELTDD